MIAKKLGRYEIEGELGKGAMGVVYLARDPIIGRKLALKTFRLGFSAGDEELEQFRQRFLREAQSAGILNHPNIVTIHDVVEDPESGSFFIAMEYVEGTDLKRILQQSERLGLDFVLDTVAQVAEGLGYAHSKGVVHRDVKPANVIITGARQAKITDFGIARVDASNLTVEGQLLGTPNYMAPEQITGREVDHRTDLFSLGVMLYELLTRHKPFAGDNLTMVSHRIVYDRFTPPEEYVPDLPRSIVAILERGLAKKAEERYASGAEMAGDLRRAATSLAAAQPSTMELPRATPVAAEPSTGGDAHRVASLPPPDLPPPVTSPGAPAVPPPPGSPPRRRGAVGGDRSHGSWTSSLLRERPPPRRALGVGLAALVLAVLAFGLPFLFVEEPPPAVVDAELERRIDALDALRAAQRHLDAGEPTRALDVVERALRRHPEHADLLRLRGEATRAVLAVEGRASEDAYVAARLAGAATALDEQRWGQAITLAEEVLVIAPEHPEALDLKGQAERGRARRMAMLDRVEEARGPEPAAPAERPADPGETAAAAGPATMRVDFHSQLAEGTLTIYGDQQQIFKEAFHFTERGGGFLRRSRDVPGGFVRELEIAAGAKSLKVYVYINGRDNVLHEVSGNFPPGRTRTLEIRVGDAGDFTLGLR